jgi:hypothetical protein
VRELVQPRRRGDVRDRPRRRDRPPGMTRAAPRPFTRGIPDLPCRIGARARPPVVR